MQAQAAQVIRLIQYIRLSNDDFDFAKYFIRLGLRFRVWGFRAAWACTRLTGSWWGVREYNPYLIPIQYIPLFPTYPEKPKTSSSSSSGPSSSFVVSAPHQRCVVSLRCVFSATLYTVEANCMLVNRQAQYSCISETRSPCYVVELRIVLIKFFRSERNAYKGWSKHVCRPAYPLSSMLHPIFDTSAKFVREILISSVELDFRRCCVYACRACEMCSGICVEFLRVLAKNNAFFTTNIMQPL